LTTLFSIGGTKYFQKYIPAKLELCIGMPIMIRNNDATECCITKGTEATVAN
jgi:hypothetical protein